MRQLKILVNGGVPYLMGCPDDVTVLLMDEDNGDEEYSEMNSSELITD
jgi:hypothetical protein